MLSSSHLAACEKIKVIHRSLERPYAMQEDVYTNHWLVLAATCACLRAEPVCGVSELGRAVFGPLLHKLLGVEEPLHLHLSREDVEALQEKGEMEVAKGLDDSNNNPTRGMPL